MDTGSGKFKRFYIPIKAGQDEAFEKTIQAARDLLKERYPNHGGTFQEGEELEIKGSRFRVSKIIRNGLKLKLLSRK